MNNHVQIRYNSVIKKDTYEFKINLEKNLDACK